MAVAQKGYFASGTVSSPGMCAYVCVHTRAGRRWCTGLSLKVLELGERGGEQNEDKDSVCILARFAGFP